MSLCQFLITFILNFVAYGSTPGSPKSDVSKATPLFQELHTCAPENIMVYLIGWPFYRRTFLHSYTRQDSFFGGSVPAQRPIEWARLWRGRTWGIGLAIFRQVPYTEDIVRISCSAFPAGEEVKLKPCLPPVFILAKSHLMRESHATNRPRRHRPSRSPAGSSREVVWPHG